MCNSPTSQKCSNCEGITYCSKTCEKADLHVHKLICKKPVPISYRGNVYWPINIAVDFPEAQTPCFREFRSRNYDNYRGYPFEDGYEDYNDGRYDPAQQLLGSKLVPTFTITGNVLRSRSRSGNQLELYYLQKPATGGTALNRSIASVTAGRATHPWRGPAIAVKVATPVDSPPQYLDMDMLDLRDVIDQLCAFPAVNISDPTTTPSAAKVEVSAVRINCPGDQALGRPKFEAINILASHSACSAPITGISQLVQFPLRVMRYSAAYTLQSDSVPGILENPDATFLNMGVDPAGAWGFVGLTWVDPAATVIVVRADGAPLDPQHVEAMCHWCLFVLKPLFDDSRAMGLHPEMPVGRDLVLARITKCEFERFYVGYDEWKGSSHRGWKKALWPFC